MRGKVTASGRKDHAFRITPAYAGKSIDKNNFVRIHRDHPRLCGEKDTFVNAGGNSWGSPPPMRGKALPALKFRKHLRITPAYAGKRPAGSSTASTPKDHPRLCGEKLAVHSFLRRGGGSPPPMRGKGWFSTPSKP